MEALLEDLFSVSVTSTPNNVVQPHPRYAEFKRRSKEESQEIRRQELLKEQKRLREITFDAHRDLGEAFDKHRKLPRSITKDKYRMMHSEWLVDIPSDMTSKWRMLLCPEGKHVLVIAVHGKTKLMDRRRQEMTSFRSLLPGGNPDHPSDITVLDCIWQQHEKKLYVLDLLCWAHHDVVDCEAEFRFFWLKCKFDETPGIMDKEQNSGYSFILLESHSCEPSVIEATMSSFPPFPNGPGLDGVLFYHMEASYVMGKNTPLVGWLKGYMVPDLLGVPVAPQYMCSRPQGMTLQDHIKAEEKVMNKRRNQHRKQRANSSKMDCDCADDGSEVLEGGTDKATESMVVEAVYQSSDAPSVDSNVEQPSVSEKLMTS